MTFNDVLTSSGGMYLLWWVFKKYDIESFDFSAKGFQNIQRMMAKFHEHSINDN